MADGMGAQYHLWTAAELESLIKLRYPQYWPVYCGVRYPVMRADIGVKGLTPELGPYYKAYKEIEKQELEKDEATGTENTVARAQDALFMMKVRIPVLDSMIPDPPLYDIDQSLSEAITTRPDSLTPEESLSVKLISMHTTFVGQRGGWFSSPPAVGTYVRVTYDNVKNLSGPVYLGEVETETPGKEGKGLLATAASWMPGGGGRGCGYAGALNAGKKKLTKAKNTTKSYLSGKGVPEGKKERLEREIKEYEETRDEITTKSGSMSEEERITVKACSQQIRKLKAELKNLSGAPAQGGGDTSPGARRQDPTVPGPSPASSCSSASRMGAPPGPFVPGRPMHDGIVRDIQGCVDPNTPSPNADKLREAIKKLGYIEKGREISNGGDMDATAVKMMISILKAIKRDNPDIGVRLTGGNDCFHQERIRRKGSGVTRHGSGRAMDMGIYPMNADTLDRVCQTLMNFAAGNDGNCRFIDEYRKPTGHATGGHFHFSWGQGSEGKSWKDKATQHAQSGTPWRGGTMSKPGNKSLTITATQV